MTQLGFIPNIKWVEAKATQNNNADTTAKFLYEYDFTQYGLPIEIVIDRGSQFLNETIVG